MLAVIVVGGDGSSSGGNHSVARRWRNAAKNSVGRTRMCWDLFVPNRAPQSGSMLLVLVDSVTRGEWL